ncbi:MAG TPA: GNAT family protein [Rhizomicrobium sp.]|nr:GNAT family protein [Rhizomicrobium sp.]
MKPVSTLGPRPMTGRFIALEPLEEHHHAQLLIAAADPETWTYIPVDREDGFAKRLPWMVKENAEGRFITFVVRRLSDGTIVGSTTYLNIAPTDAKVEIGFTWYTADARGGPVNPEAKYLLLKNAFEAGYNRVEFKTDAKNARSRAALLKLGAKEEGILRGHMWMPQGYFRDSVYFSILAAEWPTVRDALEKRLAAYV